MLATFSNGRQNPCPVCLRRRGDPRTRGPDRHSCHSVCLRFALVFTPSSDWDRVGRCRAGGGLAPARQDRVRPGGGLVPRDGPHHIPVDHHRQLGVRRSSARGGVAGRGVPLAPRHGRRRAPRQCLACQGRGAPASVASDRMGPGPKLPVGTEIPVIWSFLGVSGISKFRKLFGDLFKTRSAPVGWEALGMLQCPGTGHAEMRPHKVQRTECLAIALPWGPLLAQWWRRCMPAAPAARRTWLRLLRACPPQRVESVALPALSRAHERVWMRRLRLSSQSSKK